MEERRLLVRRGDTLHWVGGPVDGKRRCRIRRDYRVRSVRDVTATVAKSWEATARHH